MKSSTRRHHTITPMTRTLSEYISAAATRELPPAVVEKTGHHILDSLAAIISARGCAPASSPSTT